MVNEIPEHASLPTYDSRWSIAPPLAIQTSNIEADGGRWIILNDGRIVEYFVCGSDSPDASILVDCHGGSFTAKFFSTMDDWVDICAKEKLNLRVISASQPGFGYSTIQPGRKLIDWPMTDLLPILKKENVKEFMVTGVSFGSPHACAVATTFGKKVESGDLPTCLAIGLRVPYLGSESCSRLGLNNHLHYTSQSANTSIFGTMLARSFMSTQTSPGSMFNEPGMGIKLLSQCVNPGSLDNIQRLKEELGAETTEILATGCNRSVVHSVQGTMYNYAIDTLLDHGFDVQDIPENIPLVVWYADDDEDCPPSHGEYLASGKCYKNVQKKQLAFGQAMDTLVGLFLSTRSFFKI